MPEGIDYVKCEGTHRRSSEIFHDGSSGSFGTCPVCLIQFRAVNGVILAHGRPKDLWVDYERLGGELREATPHAD